MADWNKPTITSDYINFVAEMNDKFTDAATLQFGNPINLPLNTIRFQRTTAPAGLFQEWLGVASGWQNKVLAIEGGGTGSASASGSRVNLGLGSMATQNSNAVNITGGTITGVQYSASDITTGVMALARGGTGSSLTIQPPGYVMMVQGGAVGLYSGGNIGELNASSLIAGTVPLARLSGVALLASQNVFTQPNIFSLIQVDTFNVNSGYASINLYSNTSAAGRKYRRIFIYEGGYYWQDMADDGSTAINVFYISEGIVYGNGAGLSNLNANNLTSGTVNTARLGSGSANAGTFLRGDGVWSAVASGGEVSPIPSGMIAIFDTACPAGWTRYSQLDNRFPLGSTGAGATGGSDNHSHAFSTESAGAGSHSHGFSGSANLSGARAVGDAGAASGAGSGNVQTADAGQSFQVLTPPHTHNVNLHIDIPVTGSASMSGSTDGVGNHTHTVNGGTDVRNHVPPYYTVVFCRKN